MAVTGGWRPLSVQIVNSFGQGKCTFDRQKFGNFKNLWPCLSKLTDFENWEIDHFQQDLLYVDISYKFTEASRGVTRGGPGVPVTPPW